VLVAGCREDFVSLLRALLMHNEPKPVPDATGAMMVAGFNNWDRVRAYRREWEAGNPGDRTDQRWQEEFQRLVPRRELYQDRFLVLSDGPYSGVPARDMGLAEADWRKVSLTLRLEHECAHYFTRRVSSSMRNNALDELLADYQGIAAAAGNYRADWFLRFVGLDRSPDFREGGRLQNYRGDPPLSPGAFQVLQRLVKAAAENLERFDATLPTVGVDANPPVLRETRILQTKALTLVALTRLTLEELASAEAQIRLEGALAEAREWLAVEGPV
jgi:hypothetical protein